MKKEVERALQNIDLVCSNARLTRNEHAELARSVKLVYDTIVEMENPKKGKKKNDDDTKTDV